MSKPAKRSGVRCQHGPALDKKNRKKYTTALNVFKEGSTHKDYKKTVEEFHSTIAVQKVLLRTILIKHN